MTVSRQVRRQRERLSEKGRTDVPPDDLMDPSRLARRSPRMTVAEKHTRAVQRRDYWRQVQKLTGIPHLPLAPHAQRGTQEKPRFSRTKAKAAAHATYATGLLRNAEIGRDPVYFGKPYLAAEWRVRARAWNLAHGRPRDEACRQ